jgi:hypothetical protein
VVVDPNIIDDELPKVEQVVLLPGMVIVPVGSGGSGLVPRDVISVAPSGMPVGEIGKPAALPSGEVAPTAGVGTTTPPTCATATLHARSAGRAKAISKNLNDVLPIQYERTRGSWPDSVRKIDHNRCRGAADDNPTECACLRWIDFHVRQIGGNMDEVASLRVVNEFTIGAPTYLT